MSIKITNYDDEMSNRIFYALREHLQPLLNDMLPNHLLTHVGFNRDFDTDNIIIKLHLDNYRIKDILKDETKFLQG